jgi:hypothetical protein
MAWPSANISLTNVDADSDSISSARADIYQAFTSLNDIIQVGPGSGSGSGGFTGNLFGNTLSDSVNYRILANATPQQNVTQIGTYTQGVIVTTAPSYTGANLNSQNQSVAFVSSGNVNFLTSYAAGTRTTTGTTAYLGVTATSANTTMNVNDRVRAFVGGLDLNLNGKTWGTMNSTGATVAPVVANGQTLNVYGTGNMASGIGVADAVTLTPVGGSINAQYVSGYNAGLSYASTGVGYTASNIQYARLYTGTVSGMTGNLTVNNAIALHTISGWVSSNVSLVNNAYVILNEDARSVIQTNGNIVSTGSLIQTSGNITAGNVTSTNGYFWANGAAYASGSGTYANINVGAYLEAGITSNIVTTGTANKYGTMQTFNEKIVALGNVSGTQGINLSNGSIYSMTLTGNVVINTTDITNAVSGSTFMLILKQDATGSRRLTSNLSYTGANCTLSTAANSIDTISVVYDGSNYLARMDRSYSSPIAPSYTARYLIVAGGGGGGGGGGAGAGGLLTGNTTVNTGTTYTFTIGAGGTGSAANQSSYFATKGANTAAFSLTALGGGVGGYNPTTALKNGGSGGGNDYAGSTGTGANGTGTAGQGNDGGSNLGSNLRPYGAGGGGGAGAVGGNGGNDYTRGGDGGTGLASDITGTSLYWAGGGGGATTFEGTGGNGGDGGGGGAGVGSSGTTGTGGSNGGGNGNKYNGTTNSGAGGAGGANTGGGGGGGPSNNLGDGGAGGSGVVIVSIPTANYTGVTTGSPTVTTSGSNTILKFTSSGTYTA